MNKLSRFIFWGGVFAATVTLAIGVSLLAMRVRAGVDARRTSAGVQLVALPVSDDLVAPATQSAADPALDASQLPCVSDEDICEGPWGIEPASSSAAPQAAEPAALCLQSGNDVLANGQVGDDARAASVLGAEADAPVDGAARRVEPRGRPVNLNGSGARMFDAEKQLRGFRAA